MATKKKVDGLVSCPFCGEEDIQTCVVAGDCYAECVICGARGPVVKASQVFAGMLWNDRP